MNWEAAGSLGEILGAVAVIATLFYLAKQIRQQNSISEYQALSSVFEKFSGTHLLYMNNPSIMALVLKANKDPASISTDEALLYQIACREYFNSVYLAWRANEKGLLPDEEWNLIGEHFAADFSTPGGSLWRKTNAEGVKDFWNVIDSLKKEEQHHDYNMGNSAHDT